jgi:FAD dependent oxidoreductase
MTQIHTDTRTDSDPDVGPHVGPDVSAAITFHTPVGSRHDVVVAGGGPAGVAAAIAAARAGASVLLVDQHGSLGGNLTAGLVGPCMTSYSLDGTTQLITGIFDEFVRRMETTGHALHPSATSAGDPYSGFIVYGHDKVTPFEPEAAKLALQQLCHEAGVDLLLHTMVVDTWHDPASDEATRPRGLVLANKAGLSIALGSVIVDATADGDVATRAGAKWVQGRDSDGLTQPMTLFFRVAGVDDKAVADYVGAHPDDIRPFASIVARARDEGRFPSPRRGVGMYRTLRPGVWRINTTRILGRDGTDPHDLTAAELEGRHQVHALMEFFRAELPGFSGAWLLDTASTVGVRETRRIHGDYTLTLEDLQTGRHFDDAIAMAAYPVDIHDPTGAGGGVDPDAGTANVYQLPYRSLLPQGVDHLIVAGRCLSATHEALAAVRVMPTAFALGQAAGTAAALSLRHGTTVRNLDVTVLQQALRAAGARPGPDKENT